jgi:pimeloyl-ACP methyl ester carboxylesterase
MDDCCMLEPDIPVVAHPNMRKGSVLCLTGQQLHHMAYTDWGNPNNPRVLVCVHGLTRNGRDFDALATVLSDEYRVICPDIAGRGRSDWLIDKSAYAIPTYVGHIVTLLAQLGAEQVDWLGTSMGGLMGMSLAAMPNTPIRRLILNDIGPVLPKRALSRIGEYVGLAPAFANEALAETYLRKICEGFGPLTDAQWKHLTTYSMQHDEDGFKVSYDPAIGDAMRASLNDADVVLWDIYDQIHCPTLVIHGCESDLLQPQTVVGMAQRGPLAQCVEIPETGHAPMLMSADQIEYVRSFLDDVAGEPVPVHHFR